MNDTMKFYYVYILQSESVPERFYAGLTDNLENRLRVHNQGKCVHTSKFVPWHVKTAIAFIDRHKALEFEEYLKTSSGRAFAKKRL
jgi:putative endonuclease